MPTNPLDTANWGYSDIRGWYMRRVWEEIRLPYMELSKEEVERRLTAVLNEFGNRQQDNKG